MRLTGWIGLVSLCLAPQEGRAQGAWPYIPNHASCARADSILGPRDTEDMGSIYGYYDSRHDSTHLSITDRTPAQAELSTAVQLPGPGPFDLKGLGLGFTILAHAASLKHTKDSLPVTLVLDDSLTLRPGPLRIGELQERGTYPTLQVTVVLTRAGLLALLGADHAVVSWPQMQIPLDSDRIGGLRAFTRILLCAPQSLTRADSAS
jgi:hypothetical protein